MSAFPPIATDLLHYGNGRKGPTRDIETHCLGFQMTEASSHRTVSGRFLRSRRNYGHSTTLCLEADYGRRLRTSLRTKLPSRFPRLRQ